MPRAIPFRRRALVLAAAAFTLTLAGCSSRAAFRYRPSAPVAATKAPLPVKVGVLPFRDLRGDDNTNAMLLYLIPLMPFGTVDYERPEAANGFLFHASYNFRPTEDFARATVDEMRQNQYFSEVFFTDREHEPGADLIVTGEIQRTTYDGKIISYGLSVEGPLLWFLGLPAGTTRNDVAVTISMKRARDGVQVWSHRITGDWGKTVGLYYNWAADFDGFPLILRDGLHDGMKELEAQVRAQPLAYWTGVPTDVGMQVWPPRMGMLGAGAR